MKLDFTIEELEERVLVPYRKGRPITIGGKSITTDDIERIRITMTEQASAYLRPVVQQERDSSVMISTSLDFDIAAKGDDMTDGFIAAPPGSELEPAPLANTESRPPTDAREVFVVHGRELGGPRRILCIPEIDLPCSLGVVRSRSHYWYSIAIYRRSPCRRFFPGARGRRSFHARRRSEAQGVFPDCQ